MTHEQAEAIISDPTGVSDEDAAEAAALLGLAPPPEVPPPPPEVPSLTALLSTMEKAAPAPADKAIYNELAVIVGEAKMRLTQVAAKVKGDNDHIAHAVLEYFQHL